MEIAKHPLLSICIPTYNRGPILKEVLDQYLQNPEFDEDVEIVISDNCSTDDTESICKEYCEKNSNIHYYRNEVNIKDANFYTVLNYGNGDYLKLVNDWVYFSEESLKFIKSVVRKNRGIEIPIFFTNDLIFTKGKREIINCSNLDEYVQVVSTYVTSNNLFGAWIEQWRRIEAKDKYTDLKLQQVDWTYQLVNSSEGCILYDKKVLSSTKVKRTILSGYNWFQIHLDNYYQIMNPYILAGAISKATFKKDRHQLLEHFKREFCFVYFYNYTKGWKFETKGTSKILKKYYSGDPYLLYFFTKLPFYYFWMLCKDIINHVKRLRHEK